MSRRNRIATPWGVVSIGDRVVVVTKLDKRTGQTGEVRKIDPHMELVGVEFANKPGFLRWFDPETQLRAGDPP